MLDWLGQIGGIVLLDLVLSGDNALVIGAAASKLPRRRRWLAISLGGGGAIVLRILFAVLATFLLQLPLLEALGAVVLLIIAIRLVVERGENPHEETEKPQPSSRVKKQSIWGSLLTILLADVTMSLDNVLAVGAIANGQWLLLVIGLCLSILLLLVGSAIISEFIQRLPWLIDVTSLILAWTAANMLLEDPILKPILEQVPMIHVIVPVVAIGIVVIVDLLFWRKVLIAWRNAARRNV